METDSFDTYYKIGITKKEPKDRVKQLQTGNVFKIELFYQFFSEMGNQTEKALHRTYGTKNVSGEWFELTDEQVKGFPSMCERIEENLLLMKNENTYWQEKYK